MFLPSRRLVLPHRFLYGPSHRALALQDRAKRRAKVSSPAESHACRAEQVRLAGLLAVNWRALLCVCRAELEILVVLLSVNYPALAFQACAYGAKLLLLEPWWASASQAYVPYGRQQVE